MTDYSRAHSEIQLFFSLFHLHLITVGPRRIKKGTSLVFSEFAQIALVAARFGKFQQIQQTQVIIFNFTRPHATTYTN